MQVTVHEKTRLKTQFCTMPILRWSLFYFLLKPNLSTDDKIKSVWDNAVLFSGDKKKNSAVFIFISSVSFSQRWSVCLVFPCTITYMWITVGCVLLRHWIITAQKWRRQGNLVLGGWGYLLQLCYEGVPLFVALCFYHVVVKREWKTWLS